MSKMKKRIIGIDVARALAVIGMIIVNFKIVLGENGNEILIETSLSYALFFSLLCVLFAISWRKRKAMGPLEWAMRKFTH